jgi:hypothetical protein
MTSQRRRALEAIALQSARIFEIPQMVVPMLMCFFVDLLLQACPSSANCHWVLLHNERFRRLPAVCVYVKFSGTKFTDC